ncbi:MAG: hypothetical protein HQK81_15510, partial [Desulfovibrionaceae bacterium]|nr:hypothetical protein [Desulfovibrionaceae bacterium]
TLKVFNNVPQGMGRNQNNLVLLFKMVKKFDILGEKAKAHADLRIAASDVATIMSRKYLLFRFIQNQTVKGNPSAAI